ncbi:RNA polymerase II transcription elongation factor [Gracilaria domingensis]|nr:RNA polymerase II transcription elongation factor [Gracilaria domingensis]KAI0559588.1 RNA polymerase II transcription elongation factor [Gracilaria domingensis]
MASPTPNAPRIGVRYPLKVGRSIKKTKPVRSFVQFKFSHVGGGVDVRRPGVLSPARDSCNIAFASKADPTKSVSYACQRLKNVSDVGNYVLVFAAGAFWLERVDDVFLSTRAGTVDDAVDVPDAVDDDFANEPESWMDVDVGTGSPVTPDGNDAEEETVRPPAGKSTARVPVRKMPTGRTLQPMHDTVVGSKAGKTVALKHIPSDTHSPDDDYSNNDDVNEGNVSEEVEEVEVASSSDDDGSSDDSDSSGSADSGDYTDRSSDED